MQDRLSDPHIFVINVLIVHFLEICQKYHCFSIYLSTIILKCVKSCIVKIGKKHDANILLIYLKIVHFLLVYVQCTIEKGNIFQIQ